MGGSASHDKNASFLFHIADERHHLFEVCQSAQTRKHKIDKKIFSCRTGCDVRNVTFKNTCD